MRTVTAVSQCHTRGGGGLLSHNTHRAGATPGEPICQSTVEASLQGHTKGT